MTESKAAAMGGVTSSLNYIRTGHYYLNRGGPYREFMPEVLKLSEGASGSITAITLRRSRSATSARWTISRSSTASRRSRSSCSTAATACTANPPQQNEFLMLGPDDRYDIAHFEFIMRAARRSMEKSPGTRATTSASACTASLPTSSTPTPRWSSAKAS